MLAAESRKKLAQPGLRFQGLKAMPMGSRIALGVLFLMVLLAIFAPSFLLVVGVLPFWQRLRHNRPMQAALLGINAAVVDEGGQVCVSVSCYPFASLIVRHPYEADTSTGHASHLAVDAAVRRAIFQAAADLGRKGTL